MAIQRLISPAFDVSIHAPAWGATVSCRPVDAASSCFNPRARVGRDFGIPSMPTRLPSFNPRARVGRDMEQERYTVAQVVSIHAPAWGATVLL